MELDRLEFEKAETEKEINKLNDFCEELENLSFNFSGIVKEKLDNFIKETEKEIEYQEFFLQEINSSIDFIKEKE